MIQSVQEVVFLILPAALALFVTGFCVAVALHSYRRMVAEKQPYLDIGGWLALMVAVVLDTVIFAGMDIGKFETILGDDWAGIVGLISAVLFPFWGFKAASKFASPKGGEVTVDAKD